MVIRAHIHIEHHLNELLNTVIPYPGYLKAMMVVSLRAALLVAKTEVEAMSGEN